MNIAIIQHFIKLELDNCFNILTIFKVSYVLQCINNQNKKTNMTLNNVLM